jgi:alanyl-tRNA synthetase
VDLERRVDALLQNLTEQEKALVAVAQREANQKATDLLKQVKTLGSTPCLVASFAASSPDAIQQVLDALKSRFQGVIFLAATHGDSVSLAAAVDSALLSQFNAGKLVQLAASFVDGKGGGRPELARGAGKNPENTPLALAKIKDFLTNS